MNENLVKSLREKTEEADLETILKRAFFGGYSRKSVREYISIMRQQRYDMQQSFAEEMQLSQSEKDRLTRELAETGERAAAAEEALERARPQMEKAAALEKDMDEAVERIQADAVRLERQGAEIERLQRERDELCVRLEQAEAEKNIVKEQPAQPQEEQPEEVPDPSETMALRIAILTRERDEAEKRMENIIHREKLLFQALNECRAELESYRDQNRCLEAENKDVGRRLHEQIWQNISLNREVTHMQMTNETLKDRLEAALAETAGHNAPDETQDTGDVIPWNFEE